MSRPPTGADRPGITPGTRRTTDEAWPVREPAAPPATDATLGQTTPFDRRGTNRRIVRLVSIAGSDLSIDLRPGVNKIGRQRLDNHIVLVGPEISRFHAEIDVQDHRIVVRDLGSANGTFVNDSRITEEEVRPGDRLGFSEQFSFRLVVDAASDTPHAVTFAPSGEEPLPMTDPISMDPHDEIPSSLRSRSQRLLLAEADAVLSSTPSGSTAEPPTPIVAPGAGRPPGAATEAAGPGERRGRISQPVAPLSSARSAPVPARAPSAPLRTVSPDRVPPLPSPSDAHLMESISEVAYVGEASVLDQEMAALERERRQLAVLFQVSKRCMSAETLAELDRLLINVLERIAAFDRGFITYQLPSGDWKLVMSPKGDRWERQVVRKLLQSALKSKGPIRVLDSRTDDSLGSPVPGRTDGRLLLPLNARSTPVGAIFLLSAQPEAFDDYVVDFLSLFSDIAALAVVNCARLEGGTP